MLTHRLAYELTHGVIPKGKCVLHRCDTPRCCNPRHLFVGTQTDNMNDRHMKGRTHCKLSDANIREIRAMAKYRTKRAIAKRFGVNEGYIGHVLAGRYRARVG